MANDMQTFYDALTKAVNQQIAGTYDVDVTLLQTGSQGNFLWNYQSPNGIFNAGTFAFISAAVLPSPDGVLAQLSPASGFVNAYVQVVAPMYYRLSRADQASIAKVMAAATREASKLVSDYESIFNPITTADLQTAQEACGPFAAQTNQDYVISYVLGYQWSGSEAVNAAPLSYETLAAASSLADLQKMLPNTPANGGKVVSDVWSYLSSISSVVALQSAAQIGSWTLAGMSTNAAKPSATNGGMQTVDPNNGKVYPYQVAYSIPRTASSIGSDLSDDSRIITVTIDIVTAGDGTTVQATLDECPPITVPEPSVAHFTAPGCSTFDLLTCAGANSDLSVTITYTGYTLVPVAPLPLNSTNGGWFVAAPIAEAASNGNNDITGFAFALPPPYDLQSFAAGGTFGSLTNILISNPPSVTLQYSNLDAAGMLPPEAAGILNLFGYQQLETSAVMNTSAGTVTFSPLFELEASTPPMMQSAFAIGCTFINPGVLTTP